MHFKISLIIRYLCLIIGCPIVLCAPTIRHKVYFGWMLKPVGHKAKTPFPPDKTFSAVLCSSCNDKMLPILEKTAATGASMQISLFTSLQSLLSLSPLL